jgi:hypothetical protein
MLTFILNDVADIRQLIALGEIEVAKQQLEALVANLERVNAYADTLQVRTA